MWTQFWDMNSGGGRKEKWSHIYIEAKEEEARSVFYARFGHNPDRVSCTCCGSDYSTSEYETLKEATAYQRNCPSIESPEKNKYGWAEKSRYLEPDEEIPEGWTLSQWNFGRDKGMTLPEYIESGDAHFIYADNIKPEERSRAVPEQGYVWQD